MARRHSHSRKHSSIVHNRGSNTMTKTVNLFIIALVLVGIGLLVELAIRKFNQSTTKAPSTNAGATGTPAASTNTGVSTNTPAPNTSVVAGTTTGTPVAIKPLPVILGIFGGIVLIVVLFFLYRVYASGELQDEAIQYVKLFNDAKNMKNSIKKVAKKLKDVAIKTKQELEEKKRNSKEKMEVDREESR